ncbi:hypothetical protein TNCV_1751081 [Trichonephila clavipes]|nr:hypothetical protein TNCV_1751081 [Trichonephila clavipes]
MERKSGSPKYLGTADPNIPNPIQENPIKKSYNARRPHFTQIVEEAYLKILAVSRDGESGLRVCLGVGYKKPYSDFRNSRNYFGYCWNPVPPPGFQSLQLLKLQKPWKIRSQQKTAMAIVSLGIVATFLHVEQTAHSVFKLPLDIHKKSDTIRNIKEAEWLRYCKGVQQ